MKLMYIYSKILKKMRGSAIHNSNIHDDSKVEAGSSIINSTMDKFSYCGYDCTIVSSDIGKYCSIASDVKIGSSLHPLDWVSTSPAFYYGRDSISKRLANKEFRYDSRTSLKNDVWIGSNVLIKSGVTIENGAVIGMGSVVTKDIGPYEIWAGNPARFIRKRFSDEIIGELLKIKWWEFDEEKLLKQSASFDNITEFIQINREME